MHGCLNTSTVLKMVRKRRRASLPISNEWLTAIATSSILAENRFTTAQENWDELLIASKIWTKWKDQFVGAQANIESSIQASGGLFGSANAAAVFNGTGTADPTNDTADDEIIPSGTVDKLGGYLDNMDAAAINKREVLNRLVDNNEWLDTTKYTTLADIKALLTNTENSGVGGSISQPSHAVAGGSITLEVSTSKCQVQQLRAAI